jgi:hypothetical protein
VDIGAPRTENGARPVYPESRPGGIDACRTLWPDCSYQIQPSFETLAELPRAGVFATAKLADQPEVAEQADAFPALRNKAAVGEALARQKDGISIALVPSLHKSAYLGWGADGKTTAFFHSKGAAVSL